MSAATTVPVNRAGQLAAPPTATTPRGDRRWLRIVLPIGVALLVIVSTLVVHLVEQPSVADRDFLNPTSTAGIGSFRLAERLTADGREITVAPSGPEALRLAGGGDVTLLVPAPKLVRPDILTSLAGLPANVTVLLVRPNLLSLGVLNLPVEQRSRWATRATGGCPGLTPGTRASLYRDHYEPLDDGWLTPSRDCFEHALVGYRQPGRAELVLVGADDIFRNNRIGELDNATVAASLFGGHRRVVWLDLHKRELPRLHDSKPPKQKRAPRSSLPLPSWVKAAAAGLALAALLAAVAAARRLGPPVPEPLPVVVRGTETALGRGRLYRRARDPGYALRVLRGQAGQRLRAALAVAPDADGQTLVAAVSGYTGLPAEQVDAALYGPDPADDEQLVAAVAALDRLVELVLPGTPPTSDQPHPNAKEWS